MKLKTIRADWLERDGRRLDCNPYMAGAIEAREALQALSVMKEPLHSLTRGHNGGIYNGPQFRRNFVDSPDYGVRFLTSGNMLDADLSSLPLLRKRDAESSKLAHLRLTSGTTLISCSGTIGRMSFVRPDMDGVWSSQDVLKVVPDESKVRAGYLYAFLSSKFGVPMVVGGTYGAIIQHIEPEHIAALPVPRFGADFELSIHREVDKAAANLSRYQSLVEQATDSLISACKIPNPGVHQWHDDLSDRGFSINASEIEVLRAWNYSRRANALRNAITAGKWDPLGDLADLDWLRWRVMFKRIETDEEHGIEVLTQKPLFHLFPEGRWISRRYLLGLSPKYVVPDQTTLLAKQGTLGETEAFCRCEFITGSRALSRGYSDHCMRIVARKGQIEPGYLFAFLRSNAAFRLLRSLAEGSKQQDLHWRTVPRVPVPRLDKAVENEIAEKIRSGYELRNEAVDSMKRASRFVEEAIGGTSNG